MTESDIAASAAEPAENGAYPRDPETGAYTAGYLDVLDAANARADNAELGVCTVGLSEATDGAPSVTGARLDRMTRFLLRHIRGSEPVVRIADNQLVVVLPGAHAEAAEVVGRRIQLAALRGAPCAFHLGWTARRGSETVQEMIARAHERAVLVRVVERDRAAKDVQ